MDPTAVADHLPLSPVDFHVLLALLEEDLYGYALMKAVEAQSGGTVAPEVGSLYRVLARLLDQGLLEETEAPPDAEEVHRGRPRRYYRITRRGRQAARAEAGRLQDLLSLARERRLLPEVHG